MNAGSTQAAQWIATGPSTWRIGDITVYRALLPEPVFFVTHRGVRRRCNSRDECLALIQGLCL